MSYEFLKYDVSDNVAIITLNRPEVLNALSPELVGEIRSALNQADDDTSVRCIILTGEGRAFSTGFDISDKDPEKAKRDPLSGADLVHRWHRELGDEVAALTHIWHLGTPVIAAVNGYAMGGGFWYQLACDITIASDRAVFGQPEVRQVSSSTFLFAALAGWKAANRYTLTGDHFDAHEALRLGVINEVVPHEQLMERTMALAKRITLVPEASVRLNKAVTMLGLEAVLSGALSLNTALNTLSHVSHGPDTERLARFRDEGGFRAFLEARDGPFRPEPFGPKSKST